MNKNAEGTSSQLNIPSIITNHPTSDGEDDEDDQNHTFTATINADADKEPVVNQYKMKLLEELRLIDEKKRRIEKDTEIPQESEKQTSSVASEKRKEI